MIGALKKGWVVEMGVGGHRVYVVGAAALDDGRFAFDVAHDTDPFNPTEGTKIERGFLDPATGRLTGIQGLNDVALRNFGIQSPIPEPSTWLLMGLGTVALRWRLRCVADRSSAPGTQVS